MNINRKRMLTGLIAASVLGMATFAYTASNTVPASSAGAGSNVISGYAATNVAYGLNAANPQQIESVSFTLNPATAGTVRVQLTATGSWYPCTNASGSVTCATTSPQATVASADQLSIVATG